MARQPKPDEPAPDAPAPSEHQTRAEAPVVETVADEQRKRSDDMAREGVEKWKAEHDERTAEEKAGNRQVTGVANPLKDPAAPEGGSWQGSTRTTQAARHAQNPAAPR